jgi:hypothetical protein
MHLKPGIDTRGMKLMVAGQTPHVFTILKMFLAHRTINVRSGSFHKGGGEFLSKDGLFRTTKVGSFRTTGIELDGGHAVRRPPQQWGGRTVAGAPRGRH